MSPRLVRAESRARYYIRAEAGKRGWNITHPAAGGQFLEENEIVSFFSDIGLGLDRPDFLICVGGDPALVVEAKNEANKIDEAIAQAVEYADQINLTGKYTVKLAVGAAGEQDRGFIVEVRFLSPAGWVPLQSNGYPLTTIPSPKETELALSANTGTTTVSIATSAEFIDAAMELSAILRAARIEAPLRPKVIGAVVLAMYQGAIDTAPDSALGSINQLVEQAITTSVDLPEEKARRLVDALRMSGAEFDRMRPSVARVVSILWRLNVRSVLQSDADFLGMFYEAFLRYGYDNNALGIVFTPRHITRLCVDLIGCTVSDRVIDVACGTGGFLVAALDTMMVAARGLGSSVISKVKSSIYGYDTNPTVWALSMLNMFFRGDGKGNIELGSCLDPQNRQAVRGRCTRAFLNPPFSQAGEPERDFLDAAMDALEPAGLLAAVVYAGIFADDRHRGWRREFLRRHTLVGMISLPEDLFYPTAAETSIIVAIAHIPQPEGRPVLMARIWNDGFEKLKSRRVDREGSQIPAIRDVFARHMQAQPFESELATDIRGSDLGEGAEWSPQQWLPQPGASPVEMEVQQRGVVNAIFRATVQMPDLADEVRDNFGVAWEEMPPLPTGARGEVGRFFRVASGRSSGERNYAEGTCPYVSSGDSHNSIVRLVASDENERIDNGAITVTAFGMAAVQPWPFMARGNGGSAVRVLIPKYNMSIRELIWFAAQINVQRWRFFYARMAIASRIRRLVIESPPNRLADDGFHLATSVRQVQEVFVRLGREAVPPF